MYVSLASDKHQLSSSDIIPRKAIISQNNLHNPICVFLTKPYEAEVAGIKASDGSGKLRASWGHNFKSWLEIPADLREMMPPNIPHQILFLTQRLWQSRDQWSAGPMTLSFLQEQLATSVAADHHWRSMWRIILAVWHLWRCWRGLILFRRHNKHLTSIASHLEWDRRFGSSAGTSMHYRFWKETRRRCEAGQNGGNKKEKRCLETTRKCQYVSGFRGCRTKRLANTFKNSVDAISRGFLRSQHCRWGWVCKLHCAHECLVLAGCQSGTVGAHLAHWNS